MELQLIDKGFDYARKRKKWIFLLAAFGFAAYRLYHAPSVARKRKSLSKLLAALLSVAQAVSESAETVGVVSRDLKDFLLSDSDHVPNSLNQISKIARSQQFSDSLVSVTRSVTLGILRGYQSVNPSDGDRTGSGSPFAHQVLDKILTQSGTGFASVVIGSFARNLVLGFYSDTHSGGVELNSGNAGGSSNSGAVPTWVDVVCGDKCGELIGNCVQAFVSTAVAVYLDKTMHINTYDDFFSGLTSPKHETKVRDMLVSVSNGAVETLVKTSHRVLTSSSPNVGSSPSLHLANGESLSPSPSPSPASIEDLGVETSSAKSKAGNVSSDDENESGWVSKVSSTLAVPSNRKLVLDVTGRVTFETVRSVMEFLLQMFCASVKRSADIAHDAVLEVVRYAAAKSSVFVTICLYLCLHIMGGAWTLVPA